jgi:Zn-dependent protease with chaperone function
MRTWTQASWIGRFLSAARAKVADVFVIYCGPLLYSLQLVLNVVSAAARWYLVWLIATLAGLLLPLAASLVGLSFSYEVPAELLAWIGAFAPLAWSLVAWVAPGDSRAWAWRNGARRPSAEEQEKIDDSLGELLAVEPRLPYDLVVYVVDHDMSFSRGRGSAIFVTRGLIASGYLTPALAHELAHVMSLDGRLTEALNRLILWDDPLAPPTGEFEFYGRRGALAWGFGRWFLRFAGGGLPQRGLDPIWFWYWREREYLADDWVVEWDQGESLANYLEWCEQKLDTSRPRGLFNWDTHPPVALRIERIRAALK